MPVSVRSYVGWCLLVLATAACQGPPPPAEPPKPRASSKATPAGSGAAKGLERSVVLMGVVAGPKAGLITNNSANVLSNNGSSMLGGPRANVVSNHGSTLKLLGFALAQADQLSPVAGASVAVFDPSGRQLTAANVKTDANGRYATSKFPAPPGALVVVARYAAEGQAVELAALAAPPAGADAGTAEVSPASTLVAKKTRQLIARGELAADELDVAAATRVAEALAPALDAEAVVAAAILADAAAAAVLDDATQEGTAGPAVEAAAAGTTAAAIAAPAPTRTPRPPAIDPDAPMITRITSVPEAGAFVTTLEGHGFGPSAGQVHLTFPGTKFPVPYKPVTWSDGQVSFNHDGLPADGTGYVDVVLPDGVQAGAAAPGRHSNVIAFRAGGSATPMVVPAWLPQGPVITRTAPDGASGLMVLGYGFGAKQAILLEYRAKLGIANLPSASWEDRRIGLAAVPAPPTALQVLLPNGMRSNAYADGR